MGFSGIQNPMLTAEQNVIQVTGVGAGAVQVNITGGTVAISGGTVSISGTVTVTGSVAISSGTVAVSAVSGTVTIAGAVTITSGSVAVSAVSGTVTVAGAVTITSGSVAVSAVSGTVTIAGAVTVTSGSVSISSGTVAVSAVSGTVTVAGAVTITSGSVAVSAVSGTVTISGAVTVTSGSVSITSGTVAVSAVSGTVTVSGSVSVTTGTVTVTSGAVNVTNSSGTSLATTPTLKLQYTASKTLSTYTSQLTISVPINATDRVAVIAITPTAISSTDATTAVLSILSAYGATSLVEFVNNNDLPSTSFPISLSAAGMVQPFYIPVYGAIDSNVSITLELLMPGASSYSATFTVQVLTAPDASLLGSSISPLYVCGTPGQPFTVVESGGFLKTSLVSGTAKPIPAGYSWVIKRIAGNFGAEGSFYVTDGETGFAVGQYSYAAGRQTIETYGLLVTGSITATGFTVSSGYLVVSYDQILQPNIV